MLTNMKIANSKQLTCLLNTCKINFKVVQAKALYYLDILVLGDRGILKTTKNI